MASINDFISHLYRNFEEMKIQGLCFLFFVKIKIFKSTITNPKNVVSTNLFPVFQPNPFLGKNKNVNRIKTVNQSHKNIKWELKTNSF